jgi:outer membrane protein
MSSPARRLPGVLRRAAPGVWAVLAVVGLQALPTWAQGTPTTLDFPAALALARRGPNVTAAELAVQAARARLDASFPAVTGSLQAGVSQSWNDTGGTSARRGGLEPFSLSATFNVVPYGPAHDARLDAERALTTARLALDDAVRQATVDGARAYLQVLRLQRRIELDARGVALAAATAQHAHALQDTGDATAGSVADAELALTQARTALASDRLALATALADLSDLVGRAVGGVAGEPPAGRAPTASAPADALERRSDVREAALALDAARRAYAAGVRSALPSARASADLASGDGTTSWGAGVAYGTSTFQPSLQANVTPGDATASSTNALQGTRLALTLTISVPLDTSVGAALDGGRLTVAAAEHDLERTRQRAALAVASAERALESAALQARLAAAQHERAAEKAHEAARRLELGLVATPASDRARLDADDADVAARAAVDAVLLAKLELAQALGHDPMEVF